MSGLFTVEDVNGTVYRNQGFYWHMIDTSKISSDSDYADVQYDFCKVSREKIDNSYSYKYTLEIDNDKWTKGIKADGSKSIVDGKLVISSAPASQIIRLYMGPIEYDNVTRMSYQLVKDTINLNYEELNTTQSITIQDISGGGKFSINQVLTKGYNLIIYTTGSYQYKCGYLLVNLLKTDFQFNPTQNLTIGKVNKVALGAASKYKPNGALIGGYTPDIKIIYNNQTITPEYDTDDYYFNLDLTDKTEPGKVKFKVIIENNEVLNYSETNVTLESDYELITTLAELTSACDTNGSSLIKLGADITLTGGNIPVKHDIKIIGNDKTLTCTGGRLWVREGNTLNIEDLTFTTGKSCILQNIHTTVELNNCIFINNQGYSGTTYSYTNNKGSCILCRNTYNDFEDETDFITILRNCTFTNNHSAILHSGQLTVDNCRFHNTDLTYIEKDNPAFLYMTDGQASITNSVFDLDYAATTLCSNEENIGYAQSLIICGENAYINGKGHEDLQADNSLPFFDAPYNNRSHLFVKYYYPQIEECVYSSPVFNYEDKSCCHSVSGVDWVFKDNVKITKASTNTENTTRKITW